MPKQILVTGGAGFIGSHLVERLLARGDEVHVVDDLSTGRLSNLAPVREHPRLRLVVDSVMNHPMMSDLIARSDLVIHLAAAEGVKKIMEEPVATITTNVRGTEIVLDLAGRRKTPVFFASTSEVYGRAKGPLHEEQDRVLGSTSRRRGAYASTKALDEFLALAYCEERGVPVIVGRIFNTVGPRQSGAWGMVLPIFVDRALKGAPIPVHGGGDQRRSFCHVLDTVRAIEGLCDHEEAWGRVFNIGREGETSIRELAERVRDRLGSASEIRPLSYEQAWGEGFEDIEARQPDLTRIRDLLGWEAALDLDRMIDDTAEDLGTRPAR